MYLGGVWVAIDHGLPSGISALIAALHPVVTTVLSRVLLGEELTRRRAVGVLLGFLGVIAVVIEHGGAGEGVTGFAIGAMAIAVAGMAGGTLVQRRFAAGTPLLGGTALQYLATTVALGMLTLSWEGWDFHITARSIFSLVWSVLILSVAAILIMLWLLHRQAAAQVSSLFFLTPALSTIEGALLFQERLHPLSIIGLVIAVVGVWLATSTPKGVTSLQK
jgi:drug/metabolite transporter (DMT)-like permease